MRSFGWPICVALVCCSPACAQTAIEHQVPAGPAALAPLGGAHRLNPVAVPTLSPGVLLLLELEGRFSDEVAAGGGKAFARWFAEDAVTLNNGQPAVRGRGAIEAAANWDPQQYSLTWVAEGAEMGPSNDMGYTWGRYTGRTLVPKGEAAVHSGRYITVWKKLPDGTWKVTLDASADLPPEPAPAATP